MKYQVPFPAIASWLFDFFSFAATEANSLAAMALAFGAAFIAVFMTAFIARGAAFALALTLAAAFARTAFLTGAAFIAFIGGVSIASFDFAFRRGASELPQHRQRAVPLEQPSWHEARQAD